MKNNRLYKSDQISSMSEREIRAEYSRLRSIANKRLGRLEAQGLNKTARSGYRFPTIKQIEQSSKSTTASELADVSKFLKDIHSTVTGEKKFISDFRETMKEKGYGDLVDSLDDTYKMIDFLDEMREIYGDKLYSSGDLLDVLTESERLNIPHDKLKEHIDLFVSNVDAMKSVQPTKGGRTFSSSRIDSLVKKWEK